MTDQRVPTEAERSQQLADVDAAHIEASNEAGAG